MLHSYNILPVQGLTGLIIGFVNTLILIHLLQLIKTRRKRVQIQTNNI